MGVDIEGGKARIVRLQHFDENEVRLAAFEEVKFNIDEPNIEQQSLFQSAIRRVGEGLQNIAVNMEDPSLRVRRMVFAKMPEMDMLEAIKWNFRQHIEVPIEQYVVGYTPLRGVVEDNKIVIVAYGVAESAINSRVLLFKSMGLKLTSLEPTSSALLASFYINGELGDGRYHACILFGRSIVNFVIMKKDEMMFSRPMVGVNHEALIKQLVRDLNVKEDTASNFVKIWIEGSAADEEDPTKSIGEIGAKFNATLKHFYSQLVIEIQRSIDAFCILYGVERIDCIHICGFGVCYPDLVTHMGKTLGIETKVYNPFEGLMDRASLKKEIEACAPLYAVAVGLAYS